VGNFLQGNNYARGKKNKARGLGRRMGRRKKSEKSGELGAEFSRKSAQMGDNRGLTL